MARKTVLRLPLICIIVFLCVCVCRSVDSTLYICHLLCMCRSRGAHICRLICTVYVDIFAVDFTGPCSNCEIKNRENFRSAILTLASHQSQVTSMSSYVEASYTAISSICASMMVGCATAVYYVCASWVRRFAKLKPCENFVFRFLEPMRKILSPRKCQRIRYRIVARYKR